MHNFFPIKPSDSNSKVNLNKSPKIKTVKPTKKKIEPVQSLPDPSCDCRACIPGLYCTRGTVPEGCRTSLNSGALPNPWTTAPAAARPTTVPSQPTQLPPTTVATDP